MRTFMIEKFPDGEHEVPLTLGEDGPVLGVAEVTIKDHQISALARLNEEGLKMLGLDVAFYSKWHPVNGDSAALVVNFSPGIPRKENPDGT